MSRKLLDVGCGKNKTPGAVGMDFNPLTDADVIHDLGIFPYPFAADEFDDVIGLHVVEHVPDPMGFVQELCRITKAGGTIRLVCPHYSNPAWASDLTHRNHISSYSFQYFQEDRQLFDFYTTARLQRKEVRLTMTNLWRPLGIEFLVNLDNRWPRLRFIRKFWEYYLCSVIRGKDLYFTFEVVKPHPGVSSFS